MLEHSSALSTRDERSQQHSESTPATPSPGTVTLRAFLLGIILSAGMAWLNNWLATVHNGHMLGGIQMPFGAIFVLLVFALGINLPLRVLNRRLPFVALVAPVFSAVELMTIYGMLLFAALISTPGCDNQFMTMGPALFYFSSSENGWANLFYQHVPSWFAPGWDGSTFNKEVIEKLYLGGLSFSEIPWHAWSAMLIAWSVFLLLTYGTLFFLSLLLRKQWIENEALPFPLVQLPLQMVDIDPSEKSQTRSGFWGNRLMWFGFVLAATIHVLKGLNSLYPDWPIFPVNYYGSVNIEFTERPWNVIGGLNAKIFLGGIGIAYLLTREVSFSFWFFYLFILSQMVASEMLGISAVGLPTAGIAPKPTFIIFQSIGGWVMMAALLLWAAREHIAVMFRAAFYNTRSTPTDASEREPFSPRFVVLGFLFCCAGLAVWTCFARINFLYALVFIGIFLVTSIVLTRLVIEGGLLFPQAPYYPLEWMTTGMFGASALGAANITKLSFLQPTILLDTRTNLLPAFLHVLKIADELSLERKQLRRLLMSIATAVIVALGVTVVTTLYSLYSAGGLAGYTWFSKDAPQVTFNTAAGTIRGLPGVDAINAAWGVVGATVVWLLVFARSRFLWFPLHPLGYLVAPGFPLTQLWFSFFVGWLVKSVVMKYGGSDSYVKLRPFMIGLILGNLTAMIFWMLIGFYTGHQIAYWPA